MTEEQVFLAALDLPDAAARAAYLDETCGEDAAFRRQVDALLAAHFKSGEFLDVPAAEQIDAGSKPDNTVTIAGDAVSAEKDREDESDDLHFLSPSSRPDSLGRIGHYEVLQVLGRGGFGIVFRAFDEMLQRVVALKVMAPQLAATSPARKRFLREARSSAQVRHENVVQVYEVAEEPLPYLAMEFIPGETLQQKLDRVGPLDVPEVLHIGRQIAEGLAAAHATDLIHRDIKPGNVLLEGGQHKAKITDFGLARTADDANISQSGIIAGTPMYMAPEQALGQTLDQRADLFSLGSVLYQMVAGRPPFRANGTVAVLKRVAEDTPRAIREIIPETPQWLCDIIAKLHAKNPNDRYQSAREVADVLADCEAQLAANSKLKDYSRIPRRRPLRRRRRWVAAAIVVLLPVVALTLTEISGVTRLFQPHGTRDPINPEIVPTPVAADATPDAAGWVQLFNGKDLEGLKAFPPEKWKIQDKVLVGKGLGCVMTEGGDYQNFHLRIEAKINKAGAGGHYQANIWGAGERFTRTIRFDKRGESSRWRLADDKLIPADTWFEEELIVESDFVVAKINGQTVSGHKRPPYENSRVGGPVGLEIWDDFEIQIRKIEIKELPANSARVPAGAPSPIVKTAPVAIVPFTDADVQRIAALPAEQQVEEVRKELMRRNPGFDGKMEHKIEAGVVTELRIVTDKVADIAPVRVFHALRVLECSGTWSNGLLADLTPLEGLNLADLTDLKLFNNTKVDDTGMTTFKDGKNLTSLNLGNTRVTNAGLIHFKNCKALKHLYLGRTKVSDAGLAHFKGMPLMVLWIEYTGITDLTPLQGMPLEDIRLTPKKITKGLDILRDMKSLKTIGIDWYQAWPAAEFWERYDKGEFK